MQFAPWAAALVAGVAGGAVTCAAMVVPRRWMWWTGVPGMAAAVALVAASVAIWRTTARADALIAAVFISLAACAGGYALASSLVAPLSRSRVPKVVLPRFEATDARIHVVLLADAEQEDYDPRAVTEVLSRYESADVPLPPDVARPLVYASERSRYRRAGGSPARTSVMATAMALGVRLDKDGIAADVTVAFCASSPTLAEVVARLAGQGVDRIVVAGLTVAWNRSFEAAVTRTLDLGTAAAGISIEVTEPMWASPHIAAMAAQRTLSSLSGDPTGNAVVLVSEGEPWQWARADATASEHETYFAQRVRAELVEAGVAPDRIRRAWLEWEEPDVSEATRHLAALGARRIALLPVTFPVETLDTLVDLRFAADRAADETGATTVTLRAWDDDPAVIESLVEGIATAANRLPS